MGVTIALFSLLVVYSILFFVLVVYSISRTTTLVKTTDDTKEPTIHHTASFDNVSNIETEIPRNVKFLDFYLGARYPDGSLGYVADPTALARDRLEYLRQHHTFHDHEEEPASTYWDLLEGYQVQARNGTFTEDNLLLSDYVCSFRPGTGLEDEGGYKLLTEKIRIHGKYPANGTNDTYQSSTIRRPVRILCAIYTYPGKRDLLRTLALSWGYKCDGFLAFSTETIAELGLVDLVHNGPESYNNIWQKVRSAWIYIYHHYGRDYDFFHLCGDDVFMIVENLQIFLQHVRDAHDMSSYPVFLGQWMPSRRRIIRYTLGGGPGYTLNQLALRQFVEVALPKCLVDVVAASEDRFTSKCMLDLGVRGQDTRDFQTGGQQYHGATPQVLFTEDVAGTSFLSNAINFWGKFPHPTGGANVGPKTGLEAAAKYSITFHNVDRPLFMARMQAVLYQQTCPDDSPLRRALKAHVYG